MPGFLTTQDDPVAGQGGAVRDEERRFQAALRAPGRVTGR
jgi:hypothetical protein